MPTASSSLYRPITLQPSVHSYIAVPMAEPCAHPVRQDCPEALPLTMLANVSADTFGSAARTPPAQRWTSCTPKRAAATALVGLVMVANASMVVASLAFDCGTGNDHSARLEANDLLGQFNGQGPQSQWPTAKLKLD